MITSAMTESLISPEIAAQVVKNYLLPMFNNKRKFKKSS
jgi:hypothetical protein